jgi:hypothetical protein
MATASTNGGIRLLLIFSAIDMLTASLVCAIVLFVVLVGGQAQQAAALPGTGRTAAPSILEVISPGTSGGVELSKFKEHSRSQIPPYDELAQQVIPGPWLVQNFTLPPGVPAFSIGKISQIAAMFVYTGAGEKFRIFLRCATFDRPVAIIFQRKLAIDGTCGGAEPAPQVKFPVGARVLVLADTQPRAEWAPTDWKVINSHAGSSTYDARLLEATKAGAAIKLGAITGVVGIP